MQMPVDLTDDTVEELSLVDLAATLRAGPEYGANRRNARTLAKGPGMSVMLGVVAAGTQLDEHAAPGPVVLTVIDGRLAFVSGDGERELGAGSAVAFAGNVRHTVRGIDDAAFLLVITQSG